MFYEVLYTLHKVLKNAQKVCVTPGHVSPSKMLGRADSGKVKHHYQRVAMP